MTLDEAVERIEELERELEAQVVKEGKDEQILKLKEENLILKTKLDFYTKGFRQICSFFI